MKRQVRTPRLVHDKRLGPTVADLSDTSQIRARSVRCRTHDQRAVGVRVALPGLLDLGGRRRVRQMPIGVPARGDPARLQSAEDQPGDDRLVTVAADQQPVAAPPAATAIIAAFTDNELPQVEK